LVVRQHQKFVEFFFGLFAAVPVSLLKFADKFFCVALNLVYVVVSKFAPPIPDVALHLKPFAFENVFVHVPSVRLRSALALPIAGALAMPKAFAGTSGWNYKHWHGGEFYPALLKPSQWLESFSQHFKTVEIYNSFYRLPSEAAFQHWRSQVPRNFVFAIKASQLGSVLFSITPAIESQPQTPGCFSSRHETVRDQIQTAMRSRSPELSTSRCALRIGAIPALALQLQLTLFTCGNYLRQDLNR
jgi:hypothetical protein